MIWLRRFGRQLRREGPEAVGGIIQIGAEEVLKAHGLGSLEAHGAAFAASLIAKGIADGVHETRQRDDDVVFRLAAVPDLSVTPSWFVYAMPVRQHEAQEDVLAVAPRLWLSAQAAWIYAEHIAYEDMALKAPPSLISSDESMVEGGDDKLARLAWERWRQEQKTVGTKLASAEVPFGPYVLGKLPQGGMVAWKSVLTSRGVRAGVLSVDGDCSLDAPPQVFGTKAESLKKMREQGILKPHDVIFLPPSLAAELRVDDLGNLERVKPAARVWPGDPVQVKPERRLGADSDPVLLRPDWYISRDDRGGVWAWRPVGQGQVSFARVHNHDGEWRTAKWSSVSQCLKHLGALGQFGQEHPALVVAPSMAPSLAPKASHDLSV